MLETERCLLFVLFCAEFLTAVARLVSMIRSLVEAMSWSDSRSFGNDEL